MTNLWGTLELQLEWFLKFYQMHKCNYSPVLISGNDCVSGENKNCMVLISLCMVLANFTLIAMLADLFSHYQSYTCNPFSLKQTPHEIGKGTSSLNQRNCTELIECLSEDELILEHII